MKKVNFCPPKKSMSFYFLQETLHNEKFNGSNFENDNSFFKYQPENTQIQHFLRETKSFCFFLFEASCELNFTELNLIINL